MSEAIDFVAEHVLGFERKRCQGLPESGGQLCRWCGEQVTKIALPCLWYTFPAFTLVDLMRALGEKHDMAITVCFDLSRDENKFSITDRIGHICNTDTPLESLCQYFLDLSEAE